MSQLGFRSLALISPSVLVFKLAFVLADLGICWLLSRKFTLEEVLIYAWNPLIIYSFAGGGHYDSWFILPLVASWLAFDRNSWYWSSFLIGISIAIKWVSLPILSFVVWRKILEKHQNTIYYKIQQVFFLLLTGLLPMCVAALNFCLPEKCSLIPTSSNFVVNGRSAELMPYLVSLIWEQSTKYNWIYGIPLVLGVGILIWNCRKFLKFAEWYFFLLFALSPIIHAWYFTWFIPFAVATRNLGIRWIS